ncbi:MAG: signal peptidase II [Actinomycetota bacterium]|nr:signal peptidase II [Actinomycetota bacterium]
MRQADREGKDQGPSLRDALHQGQAGGGAHGLTAVRRRALILYGTAAGVYGLDRVTKILAERFLRDAPVELIEGVLDLRFTTNPGGAFGILGGIPWLFVAISLVVVGVVVVASTKTPALITAIGLGLILGGALGNLTDRAIRGPGFAGEVVDFIDLQIWPVFNLADSAIVIGAAVLFLSGLRRA